MYAAVLFDMDGVIVDFPPGSAVYREAVADAFRAFDVEPAESELEAFVGASKTVSEMRKVCERYGVEFPDLWVERGRQSSVRQRRMMERGERAPYDDSEVLRVLSADHGIGLITSNQQATAEFAVEHFDFDEHVDAVRGRDPTVDGFRRIKPDPYYVETTLSELGTKNALLVGDSESDVRAADAAGIDSAFVWRPHRQSYELDAAPTYEIENLNGLRELVYR